MFEKVKCEIKTYDNYIEITPVDGIKDNSVYEIKLHNIKQINGLSEINNQKITIYTKITPSYSTVEAVRSLLLQCDTIPDSTVLYHIREASKYVEYVTNKKYSDNDVPFNVFQFVKYKAAYDSLISFTISGVSGGTTRGKMGDVEYENSFTIGDLTDLLKVLKADMDKWYDSLFGVIYKGPAKPAITVKSSYILDIDIRNDDPPKRSYSK